MRAKEQPIDRMRKPPTQERAQETVKIIFEAAARILERDGRAAFNTNAVAELAGISIGTLYHYFQSKDAILIAMARCVGLNALLVKGERSLLVEFSICPGGWR